MDYSIVDKEQHRCVHVTIMVIRQKKNLICSVLLKKIAQTAKLPNFNMALQNTKKVFPNSTKLNFTADPHLNLCLDHQVKYFI